MSSRGLMRRAVAGFTLLELLIAIALFALLGLATYRMLEAVLRSDEVVRAQETELRQLGRAVWRFEQDLVQAVPRPVRDGYGDEQNAVIGQLSSAEGGASLELTRSGWRNPTGMRRSNLQRVRWRLAGENLERLYWVVLDRDVDSEPRVQRVLEGVTELRLRYLDAENAWHEEWPPFDFGRGNPDEQARRLPVAVEVSFDHQRYGTITRLLRLPDGPTPAPQFIQPDSQGVPEPDGEGEMQ
ncbi:general secretion pathway protein GspJ [Stutzerimonas stutzeri]|uniref:Type II secretion system protein J n=1 Tax=Stutzerimonas stutzeri TaxID=316 RepID=W8R2G4_STUST|nr:type II secretion system minor pseudopilin GspJ [Stutzerimonas stutzeri]AHL73703.1 general secretion pathway protein GspJ [Stutzerimonas stutzeri]MCQ4328782.1 type II secretion system minor pseudopilin GspJ [Stutzerimonas stutzeri]